MIMFAGTRAAFDLYCRDEFGCTANTAERRRLAVGVHDRSAKGARGRSGHVDVVISPTATPAVIEAAHVAARIMAISVPALS